MGSVPIIVHHDWVSNFYNMGADCAITFRFHSWIIEVCVCVCECVCACDLTAHTIEITEEGESAKIVYDLVTTTHHNKNTLYILKTKRENILKLNQI